MMGRLTPRAVVLACLLAGSSLQAHALFYDPFPDAASIKPADELEERIWDEAETFRAQFVRGRPSPAVETMQRIVRGIVLKNWPERSHAMRVFVIENADVLAISSANGDIILSTGMLMRLDSADELQVVLAREMAHVTHRHALRSVHAARLAAGAKTVFELATDAADLASKVTGAVGVADAAKAAVTLFKVSPEMLMAGGRALIQDQINKLKENMADSVVRSMSATGFGAMVKSSLFGYSESLENEADAEALRYIEDKFGSVDVYKRVMQRLLDEAVLDEKKFSAFYANEDRLYRRLKSAANFAEGRAERLAIKGLEAGAVARAPETSSATDLAPLAARSVADLPKDAIELSATPLVAAVVLDNVAAAAPVSAEPGAHEGEPPYHSVLGQLAIPVLETELESGRLARVIHNIERQREVASLPEQTKALLAESYASLADPVKTARGEALAQEILARQPNDARMLKLVGLMALKRGDVAQAKVLLTKAREHMSSDDERGFIDQYLRQADKKLSSL